MKPDQELLDLIRAFGPISASRISDRLAEPVTVVRKRINLLRSRGEIFNTREASEATYSASVKNKTPTVQPQKIDLMLQPVYGCPELHQKPVRLGADEAQKLPSRIGDWLFYKDGTKELCK